jgi:hypothetical protein
MQNGGDAVIVTINIYETTIAQLDLLTVEGWTLSRSETIRDCIFFQLRHPRFSSRNGKGRRHILTVNLAKPQYDEVKAIVKQKVAGSFSGWVECAILAQIPVFRNEAINPEPIHQEEIELTQDIELRLKTLGLVLKKTE